MDLSDPGIELGSPALHVILYQLSYQGSLVVKNPLVNAGDIRDVVSVPGLGRPPGGGHGNPLQYSCLENPMDRGAWWAKVHRVAESDMIEATWLA